MNETMTKIAAGLEKAFSTRGFAEPSVEDLRDAAGVSLRTLYKYTPSRDQMVHVALNHRHLRYLEQIFTDLPADHASAMDEMMERVGLWMQNEASHGCLFHAAVAAAPDDADLRALLEQHKSQVAQQAAIATGLNPAQVDILLVLEGLTQSWPLHRAAAVASAKRLGKLLLVKS